MANDRRGKGKGQMGVPRRTAAALIAAIALVFPTQAAEKKGVRATPAECREAPTVPAPPLSAPYETEQLATIQEQLNGISWWMCTMSHQMQDLIELERERIALERLRKPG